MAMNPNEVKRQETQSVITEWSEQNDVREYISAGDVSANVLYRLRDLEKDGFVWHKVTTNDGGDFVAPGIEWFGRCNFCAQLDHLKSKCMGSKGFGWTTVGFYVAKKSSPLGDEFWVPHGFPCASCNSDGSYNSLDKDCSDCDGEGTFTVNYQWPG
jgi:hypothetical protein